MLGNVTAIMHPVPMAHAAAERTAAEVPAPLTAASALQPAHPSLYADMWGLIGTFASRADLLNIRTASTDLSKGVDRSIRGLTVRAERAPAMLGVLGSSQNLKHIDSIRIEHCTNLAFPGMIAALAALPHDKINLELTRETKFITLLDAQSLSLLANIAPASLHLADDGMFSHAEVAVLAQLDYPLSLSAAGYWGEADVDVGPLANIAQLVSLNVYLREFSDQTAQAFQRHPVLTALYLRERGLSHFFNRGIVISDDAVAALAGSISLRTLEIGATVQAIGHKALAALAANTSLEHLKIGAFHQWLDAPAAECLSTNTTLKFLEVPLKAGLGHLARMPSLEVLSLANVAQEGRSQISLEDARQFAQHAKLKALSLHDCDFEGNALAILVSSAIEAFSLRAVALDDEAIDAMLANRGLRSLTLTLSTGLHATGAQLIALAAHPTLTALTIKHGKPDYGRGHRFPTLTDVQRTALYEAWGRHRPVTNLTVEL